MYRGQQTGQRAAGLEEISGSVERVTFHSEETGFCVLRVRARGHRDLVTIVGSLPSVAGGEWVRSQGQWVVSKAHGRQFQADSLKTEPPDTLEGMERFLGSGLIKGIGPVYASKLVKQFGRKVFDVIDKESALLEKVDGIGKVRRLRIKEGWMETKAIRSIMSFLMSNGVSTARAFRIYRAYGDKAIDIVRADPYCLARDIRGIGFKTADQVGEKLGIGKTSDLRARAGVEHVLQEFSQEGHCACYRTDLASRATDILEIPDDIVEQAIDYGITAGRLIEETEAGGAGELIYLAPMHEAEVYLAQHLRILSDGVHPCPPIDVEKAIAWCEYKVGLELAPAQREAMKIATAAKVMVMTGGPGVGKTTLVNAIIKVLAAKELKVVLCAPTGRAAKRMTEATGRRAKTIHRLLVYEPRTGRFKHDRSHPLSGDVFVVDEASMIDLQLAYQLVRAIPLDASLILVGDVDQLPSVGPGTVLGDIIGSGAVPVCRLTHVFRQAAESDIITNAHRIHRGEMPRTGEPGSGSDFYFVEAEDPEKGAQLIVKMVRESIPARFRLDPMRDIQVVTPMHRGLLGAQNLNVTIQQALNPQGDSVERFGYQYRVNDKVMQTENDYDKDVFNGDIGQIKRIDRDEGKIIVRYDDADVTYDIKELDELIPSYAITIHKSQGSEYPCVVIPIHTQHYIMLQRNLLYTAVTRGKRLVVLVGTRKALSLAISREDARKRITTLRERLR